MVAESVAAKIFKIGSVVFELWPFYLITPWSAFVSITKNEHDETTYSKSMERRDSLIALYIVVLPGHLWSPVRSNAWPLGQGQGQRSSWPLGS